VEAKHMARTREVDTGEVFKHPVLCLNCDQEFYFTLRRIAQGKNLACPSCGSDINLADEPHRVVVSEVTATIARIDQSYPPRPQTSNLRFLSTWWSSNPEQRFSAERDSALHQLRCVVARAKA
jgi:hypothetical protein